MPNMPVRKESLVSFASISFEHTLATTNHREDSSAEMPNMPVRKESLMSFASINFYEPPQAHQKAGDGMPSMPVRKDSLMSVCTNYY